MTDAGINGLCLSVIDDRGMKDERVALCKAIRKLDIRHTKVTNDGMVIAFENLPDLKELLSSLPIQVLAELSVRFPQYSLTLLECCLNYCYYEIGSLWLAAFLCSSKIKKVKIEIQKGITNVELLGLLQLKNLCELSIDGTDDGGEESLTFDGGVAPLLMAFGSKSLTSLKLKNLEMKIDIGVILETCPLLSTLSLKNINLKQPERFGIRRILPKLKFLCLRGDDEYDPFPSYYLTSLLSSPDLCEVDINYVRALTDQVLFDAASHNQFSKLELLKIALADSDTVTKKGIDLFLKNTNILKKIILRECDSIKQKDVVEWKSLIITNNWQLVLEIV